MKSTFSTQSPANAPSIDPLQRRAWRNGAIREDDGTYDGTGDVDNLPHDLRYDRRHDQSGTATWNGILGSKLAIVTIYHRDRKTPRQSTRKTGSGTGRYHIRRLWRWRSPSRFSRRIPARITGYRFGVLDGRRDVASRSRFPLGLYERRGGGPFSVPSPRPVFRCSACPTRRSPRPCHAWLRRCPGACGNRLRARSLGR